MDITIWLLKMACFLLHTSHILSNIYNSANFPDRLKHLQTIGKNYTSSSLKCYMLDTVKNRVELTSKLGFFPPTCPCFNDLVTRPACFGSDVDPAYCVTIMDEVYCGTMAQMRERESEREKKKGRQTSTLPHMAPTDVGTKFTITFLEDKFELNTTSSQSRYLFKNTCCGT